MLSYPTRPHTIVYLAGSFIAKAGKKSHHIPETKWGYVAANLALRGAQSKKKSSFRIVANLIYPDNASYTVKANRLRRLIDTANDWFEKRGLQKISSEEGQIWWDVKTDLFYIRQSISKANHYRVFRYTQGQLLEDFQFDSEICGDLDEFFIREREILQKDWKDSSLRAAEEHRSTKKDLNTAECIVKKVRRIIPENAWAITLIMEILYELEMFQAITEEYNDYAEYLDIEGFGEPPDSVTQCYHRLLGIKP